MKRLVSAEHAGARIPPECAAAFAGAEAVLATHEALDPGTEGLFAAFAGGADAAFIHRTCRLVVEVNRSVGHPALFSRFTAGLDAATREALLEDHYHPHRRKVSAWVARTLAEGHRVLHVGLHSFTPVWGGVERAVDVGLLFDPRRPAEKAFCARWQEALRAKAPGLRVRFNQPYEGRSDGLTTALRRRFGPDYLGIELELNQRYAVSVTEPDPELAALLVATWRQAAER
jgi:predicted N-formylglutamate amidohydrolase